ncbi:chromosomal replication initiator protein DnaA [Agrococcus sp. SGAir0287]|uniref:chromosomal replication initiator protein DnaA n=1 Tax=Agrococcus sp. SGAir0287 TaxID=2070347 RepID=UPI0010CD60EB|nr:chromosomal replication initiator protein DnaA [Agrococcus sp. SGAir0287]QCR18027.1 chromosomal replication initiator protein DnaA [Agrococcus sp. SGAir0287]
MSDGGDAHQLWAAVMATLAGDQRIPPSVRGFLDLVEPQGTMGSVLYLDVPNDLTRDMIEQRLRIPVTEALVENAVDITSFKIVVNPELELGAALDETPESPAPYVQHEVISAPTDAMRPVAGTSKSESRLNPKYVFDNFVIGGSNRFAHAAALAVAEAPAKAYNPLFIYGESGLGKTHLLHAIGHYAENMYPGIRVRYVSSEEFTNDFINSIANNQGQAFQARYREVDVLLIDDIQFLQGKESTQEAFFHTFNTLHDHDKQVVITSDVAPKHLTGFEARMVSRFEWGLITDVTAPDLETRIAILRKKALAERMDAPDDILEQIAERVTTNIRELEGTLIRVTAFASLNRLPVTMDLAQTVLKDLFAQSSEVAIGPSDIITHTASYFQLTEEDLYGSSRSQTVALARQIAMYLCREMTSLSLPKIGQLFGNRDHTTVMYANKKIEKLMKEKRSVYTQVTELTARIKQSPAR